MLAQVGTGRHGLLQCSSVEVDAGGVAADEARAASDRRCTGSRRADRSARARRRAARRRTGSPAGSRRRTASRRSSRCATATPSRARSRRTTHLEQHRTREVGGVQLAVLERRVLDARAVEAHARHPHRAELAAHQLRAAEIDLGEIAVLRAHAVPQRALPLRRAQIALAELRALEPAVVAVGAAQIEALERRRRRDRSPRSPTDGAANPAIVRPTSSSSATSRSSWTLDCTTPASALVSLTARGYRGSRSARRRAPLRIIWLRADLAAACSMHALLDLLDRLFERPCALHRRLRRRLLVIARRAGLPVHRRAPSSCDHVASCARLRARAPRRTASLVERRLAMQAARAHCCATCVSSCASSA